MDKRYYVYEWYVKGTGEVFYIGKGTGGRAKQLKENKYFLSMYKTHDCDYRIIRDNLTESQAFGYEIELIDHYKKNTDFRVTNMTPGGNQPPIKKGYDAYNSKLNKLVVAWMRSEYKNNNKSTSKSIQRELQNKHGIKFSHGNILRVIHNKSYIDEMYIPPLAEVFVRRQSSLAHLSADKNRVKVVKLDLSGNFISEYEGVNSASRETGIPQPTISANLLGITKQAKGFVFIYKENYEGNEDIVRREVKSKTYGSGALQRKAVVQYSKSGKFIKLYESATAAGEALGVEGKRIGEVCKGGRRKSYKGYVFKWEDNHTWRIGDEEQAN